MGKKVVSPYDLRFKDKGRPLKSWSSRRLLCRSSMVQYVYDEDGYSVVKRHPTVKELQTIRTNVMHRLKVIRIWTRKLGKTARRHIRGEIYALVWEVFLYGHKDLHPRNR